MIDERRCGFRLSERLKALGGEHLLDGYAASEKKPATRVNAALSLPGHRLPF
jgi:hypothetical protein